MVDINAYIMDFAWIDMAAKIRLFKDYDSNSDMSLYDVARILVNINYHYTTIRDKALIYIEKFK